MQRSRGFYLPKWNVSADISCCPCHQSLYQLNGTPLDVPSGMWRHSHWQTVISLQVEKKINSFTLVKQISFPVAAMLLRHVLWFCIIHPQRYSWHGTHSLLVVQHEHAHVKYFGAMNWGKFAALHILIEFSMKMRLLWIFGRPLTAMFSLPYSYANMSYCHTCCNSRKKHNLNVDLFESLREMFSTSTCSHFMIVGGTGSQRRQTVLLVVKTSISKKG